MREGRPLTDLMNGALQAYQQARWSDAVHLCEEILRLKPGEPKATLILGNVFIRTGDLSRAQRHLEMARAAAPADVHILNSLGSVYRLCGRLSDAQAAFEAAIKVDGHFAPAHNNLGNVFEERGDDDDARAAYQQATVEDPTYAEPLKNLAALSERQHRLAEARAFAVRALALSPNLPAALLTLARVDLREDNPTHAISGLEPLQRRADQPGSIGANAAGIMGQAHEKLGQYEQAFACFEQANDILRSLYAPRYADYRGALSLETIAKLRTWMQSADVATWQQHGDTTQRSPVFLVGFPRSGTTLLDQILSSHPAVQTLEEKNNLTESVDDLILREGALERWSYLTSDEIKRYREAYWTRVRGAVHGLAPDKLFVDKLPLNTVFLPLIHRLFPNAKIVFALRDPRDVVVSCFQQRFEMNGAMFQMLSLASAVRYYDAVMGLGSIARRRLPLNLHVVRYEDVVVKFDATIASLVGFLDLPWSNALRNYAGTAKRRAISTPSAAQVVQPLYDTSIGKWRHYLPHLVPVAAALDVWVDAFGYVSE